MILKTLILSIMLNISLLACAGGWDYNQKEFIFLEKREAPFSEFSQEINSAAVYNSINWDYEEKNKKENLKEWKKELKDVYSLKEIEDFVYKRINLDKLKDKEILDYINLVKEQEKHVTFHYYFSDDEKKKLKDYNLIINESLNKIEQTSSQWLKLRYFYLALRLAHYKKENPLKIYEKYKYLLDSNDKTIAKDWILGLHAGALVKNGEVVNGVYEFSKLFSEDKINWHLSYYNFFHIKTNEQWNELLNLAKTNEEKTKF